MDMIKEMEGSEAVEVGLRSGHVLYGRFREIADGRIVMFDPDGAVLFIPMDGDNIAYVKLVPPDAELSATINRLNVGRGVQLPMGVQGAPPPRQSRVDTPPVILGNIPHDKTAALQAVAQARARLESVKERYRHATNSFKEAQQDLRPAYRPTIQVDDEVETQEYNPTVLPDKEEE